MVLSVKTFEPKACGPMAWKNWTYSGIGLFFRTSLWIHGFHAALGFLALFLFKSNPAHTMSLCFLLIVVGLLLRPCQESLASFIYKNPFATPIQQWKHYWGGLNFKTNKYSVPLVFSYFIASLFLDFSSTSTTLTKGAVALSLCSAIFIRPWGTLNIYDRLLASFNISVLHAFQIQWAALILNRRSFGMLLLFSVLILVFVLCIPLLALLLSYPFLYACIMKCAYVDIFEGGLPVEEKQPEKSLFSVMNLMAIPIKVKK